MVPLRFVLKLNPFIKGGIRTQSINLLGSALNVNIQNNYLKNIKSIEVDCVRHYAKGKEKEKEKARNKGVKFATYKLSDERMNEIINLTKYHEKLEKTINTMQDEFVKQLSLRSTVGSIESVKVRAKGQSHELQDIAQIIRKGTKRIVVDMAAFPDFIPAALQAISKSGLNLNPQQDGTTLFIPVPQMTREHREGMAKNAKALYIKYRDQIKNIQNEFIRKIKNNSSITQDDSHAAQAQLTAIASEFMVQAEKIFEKKQKELLAN